MSLAPEQVDLSVKVGALPLTSPVLTASGCFGYGLEYADLLDYSQLGGLCTKGLSLAPRPGNPPPRITETAAGMLNAIGLENIGIEAFLAEKLPGLEGIAPRVIANLFGTEPDHYAALAEACEPHARIDAVELNISCPNVKAGGVELGLDPRIAAEVTAGVRAATRKPVWVKLSPNAGDRIVEVAAAVVEAGADALTLINTISGMAIDVERRRPVLTNVTGGLSGPAIKPLALRLVHRVHQAVDAPLVGIGGIATAEDAIAFLLAGASAVQVGTAVFADPTVPEKINAGLREYCARHGIGRVEELTGALQS
ncbi:MAG: dihydroorotate dehydrogenase [Deltaproteobacteria bacterium]|nr:dihydroorotate dehydrogenase [Deltaproteobacteria bacterium]